MFFRNGQQDHQEGTGVSMQVEFVPMWFQSCFLRLPQHESFPKTRKRDPNAAKGHACHHFSERLSALLSQKKQ